MSIEIGPATNEEIPEIEAILAHGVRSKMYRGDLAWGETITNEDRLRATIAGGNMYLAYSGDDIIGVFMLFWDDPVRWGQQPPDSGYLHRLVVAPGLRGDNVGGQIIDLICHSLADQGRTYLRLTCPSGNQQLQRYHLAHGFVRADSKARPARSPDALAYFERPVIEKPEERNASESKPTLASRLRKSFWTKP